MEALDFYDEKPISVRKLEEGYGIKNSHNFVKAALIKRFIPPKKRILDLGCGQGGDLIKLKHVNPSFYAGVDSSYTAIVAAQKRCSQINLKCRCKFFNIDFTKNSDWGQPFDIINSQFAIHFAFESAEKALFTIQNINKHLIDNGLFIGSVPNHPHGKTGEEVTVKLPGDDRYCKEFAVDPKHLISICENNGFDLILFESFDIFYNNAKECESELFKKMQANFQPDPNNCVFCFQKVNQI